MNLLLVDAGQLVGGAISDVGAQSYGYDAAGRRTLQTTKDASGGTGQVLGYGYDFADRLTLQTSATLTGTARTDRTIEYQSLAGTQVEHRYDYGSTAGNTQAFKLYDTTQRFNTLGQATQRTDWVTGQRSASTSATAIYQTASQLTTYDLAGNIATVLADAWAPPNPGSNANQVDSGAYYLANHSEYTYSYYLMEGYRERGQALTGYASTASGKRTSFTPSETGEDYDANGRLVQLRRSATSATGYLLDNAGHIVLDLYTTPKAWGTAAAPHTQDNVLKQWDPTARSASGTSGKMSAAQALGGATDNQTYRTQLYLNDQQVGASTESRQQHKVYTDKLDGVGTWHWALRVTRATTLDLGGTRSTQPTAGSSQACAVQSGDTMGALAQRFYGDAALWYVIADANALAGDANSALEAGQSIQIPQVARGTNTASSFKVYDPARLTGNTSPEAVVPPPPPRKDRCGAASAIIGVIVAVIVTALARSPAAGAAAGDAARQYSAAAFNGRLNYADLRRNLGGLALGLPVPLWDALHGRDVLRHPAGFMGENEYNYRATAVAAASAYAGQQVGEAMGEGAGAAGSATAGEQVWSTMATAAVTNVVSQGASMALGLQDHFSWRAVVASAVAAPVAQSLGNDIGGALDGDTAASLTGRTLAGMARGVVGQGVRMLITRQGRVEYALIAADAFGQAIASDLKAKSSDSSNNTPPTFAQDVAAREASSDPLSLNDLVVRSTSRSGGFVTVGFNPNEGRSAADIALDRLLGGGLAGSPSSGSTIPETYLSRYGIGLSTPQAPVVIEGRNADASGHFESFATADAMGSYDGGSAPVWVSDGPRMSYAEEMRRTFQAAEQIAYGGVKGAVNGVPAFVVGVFKGYSYVGAGLRDGYDALLGNRSGNYLDRAIQAGAAYTGEVWGYGNGLQRLGGYAGELASPWAYANGLRMGGQVGIALVEGVGAGPRPGSFAAQRGAVFVGNVGSSAIPSNLSPEAAAVYAEINATRAGVSPRLPRDTNPNVSSIVRNPDGTTIFTIKSADPSLNGLAVNYSAEGFPNYSSYLYRDGVNTVQVKMTGSRNGDFAAANRLAGYGETANDTPIGYTWHHNEDLGLMQLVNEDVHAITPHAGGVAIWQRAFGISYGGPL